MSDRFTLLIVSLTAIGIAFFLGVGFGRSFELEGVKKQISALQVSLEIHTGSIRVDKSDPRIRVIMNGQNVDGSGSVKIAR